MKITAIKAVGKKPVYDISVNSDDYDKQQYVLENGVITHNTGIYYSADTIWILGRQQDKKGTEIQGYHFIINVEKSRYVKEKSKVPITVSWEGGVEKYSGLLDVALAGGFVVKPSNGWYQPVNKETGEVLEPKVREAQTLEGDFWKPILSSDMFKEFVKKHYTIGYRSDIEGDIIQEDEDSV